MYTYMYIYTQIHTHTYTQTFAAVPANGEQSNVLRILGAVQRQRSRGLAASARHYCRPYEVGN